MRAAQILPLILSVAPLALAECCGNGECVSWHIIHGGRPGRPDREVCNRWKCADGYVHGWASCCGVSKCNVFCCNCDKRGGKVCRTSTRSMLVQDEEIFTETVGQSDAEMFRAANLDGTGYMSIEEFAAYFGVEADDAQIVAKFVLHDKNGDGYLQVGEMRMD